MPKTKKPEKKPAKPLPKPRPKAKPPKPVKKPRRPPGTLRDSSPIYSGPVGELIEARREALSLTLQRLADMVGCAKSFMWLVEHNRASPSPDLIDKLQHALGFKHGELQRAQFWAATPPDVREAMGKLQRDQAAAKRLAEILTADGIDEQGHARGSLDAALKSGELRELVDRMAPEPRVTPRIGEMPPLHAVLPFEVPLINKVVAGYPREFTDLGYPARVASEYVRAPDLTDPDAFACRVIGDSMLPEYKEGDIVVFSPSRVVKSGMDCFVRIEPDQETTFKRVFIERDADGAEQIRLQPLNEKYPARTLPRENVAGLYVAVSVTRTLA